MVPNIAANPTIGGQLGIKAVAGKKLGVDPNTRLSVAATSASITSKGIIYFYLNHNIFTNGNKWNYQGNLVAAKTVTPDFGLGIGHEISGGSDADKVLADPAHKVYAIHSYYFNIREKAYKEVAKNLLVGAGMSFEIRRSITTKDTVNNARHPVSTTTGTAFRRTIIRQTGFCQREYITRDNPNRAYKGIYFDAGFRV